MWKTILRWAAVAAGCISVGAGLTARAALSPEEQKIADWAKGQRENFVRDLAATVAIDSATESLAGVRQLGELHAAQLRELGFAARFAALPPETQRAGHLIAERAGTRGKRLLLIGHLDTVLPGAPGRLDGDKFHGSGAADMKGGNLIVIYALRALHAAGALEGTQINLIFTGDEEAAGDPIEVSRRDLHELATRSDLALAFEGATGNYATVGRRGIISWELEVQGATGHSSGIWGQTMGSGAVYEVSRILAAFHDTLRQMDGLSCNTSLVVGGTTAELERTGGRVTGKDNIVAQRALARGDLRFLSAAQLAEAKQKMQAIVAKNYPRTSAELRFTGDRYPAMEVTPENLALLAQLDQVSRDLGYAKIVPQDPRTRGAGDISFVSPPLPGLDGLGMTGRGAHAPGEYAELSRLEELIQRTALLIYRLTR
jgi:glutamate carboxypeptidase